MREVTATEASRRFASLLDGVEHRGERYTIVRRGRVVAYVESVVATSGARAKALLRRHRIDPAWADEVAELRGELTVEERFCRSGRPRRAHNLIIAATARAFGRTVVTSDRNGFVALPGVAVRRPT